MEGRVEGEKGLMLFGVRIVDGESRWKQEAAMDEGKDEAMKKSILKSSSMVNLPVCEGTDAGERIVDHGYLSEGGMNQTVGSRGQRKKRGVKWTEEEHHTFLAGLERLGKGDWRGIARNFVVTKTPTQVASHAQKYFLRKSNPLNKKRRSSLFDVEISNKIFPAQSSLPNQRPATLDQTASAFLNRSNSSIRSANLELTIAPPQSDAILAKFSSGIIKVI